MKSMTVILFLLPLFMFLQGCSKDKEEEKLVPKKIVLTAEQGQLVDASNAFGFKMLDGLVKDEPDGENVFISPLSIELALSMTLNGAKEATNDSMRKAMQFNDMDMSQINVSFKNLMNELLSVDKKVTTEIANSIWYRNTFVVEQEFINVNKDYYSAEVKALDFDSPEAKDIINQWVADKTRNKIRKIVDEIRRDHVMFLINAIYFKGIWQSEFKVSETAPRPFYLKSGAVKQVPTMKQKGTFPFYSGNNFSAVELPYGRGNYSMLVLLPNINVDIEEVITNLSPETWNTMTMELSPMPIDDLQLPKFRFAYEKKLKEMLTKMGMGLAFVPGDADFRGINRDGGLFISEVKHKTFVEVNEEGTEAAAVTSVEIGIVSMPQTIVFKVNKPFVFAIREKYTNAILFIGCVQEPKIED